MRTLVHLSDLHFGRIDAALITPLVERVHAISPDLVVVSGDLTQRATSDQFRAAREFLEALSGPRIVVPGNHDIPLHNVFDRFARPLDKYRRYITADLEPAFVDASIAVLGVNTARSATIKDGRISTTQIERLDARLRTLDENLVRIVVTHHPFDLPSTYRDGELVGRASRAMRVFAERGVDLLLAGHLHVSHSGDTALRYRMGDYAALAVQAGTATSTRGRGETNSFNVLRVEAGRIVVEPNQWHPDQSRFLTGKARAFERAGRGWRKSVDPVVDG